MKASVHARSKRAPKSSHCWPSKQVKYLLPRAGTVFDGVAGLKLHLLPHGHFRSIVAVRSYRSLQPVTDKATSPSSILLFEVVHVLASGKTHFREKFGATCDAMESVGDVSDNRSTGT